MLIYEYYFSNLLPLFLIFVCIIRFHLLPLFFLLKVILSSLVFVSFRYCQGSSLLSQLLTHTQMT